MNTIRSIGREAHRVFADAVARGQTGVVCGVTSRGIFAQFPPRGVVFLSRETQRGPLTANLSEGAWPDLTTVELHEPVSLAGSVLRFDQADRSLSWNAAAVWQAAPPERAALAGPGRRDLFRRCTARLIEIKDGSGYSPVLARLAGLDLDLAWDTEQERVWQAARSAHLALKNEDPRGVLDSLYGLLGRGSGLTPSGDDLVAGLLLALNRWRAVFSAPRDLQGLNRLLSDAAAERTTLLSANLVACAAAGQADERLVAALDGLMTGEATPEACAEALAGWGNSSGLDSLIGQGTLVITD